MAGTVGTKIERDGLVLHYDLFNPDGYDDAYAILNQERSMGKHSLNTTIPVAFVAGRFTTFDEVSPTSIHVVNHDDPQWASLGFKLLNKDAISYTIWHVKCTIEVVFGQARLYMGSSRGGYNEGIQRLYYTPGTFEVDDIFVIANNYTNHEGSQLEFCLSTQVALTEVRITNLDVREMPFGGTLEDGATYNDNAKAVFLDGINDFIGSPLYTVDAWSDNDPFTVSIWVQPLVDIDASGGLVCNQKYHTESEPGGFGVTLRATNSVDLSLTDADTSTCYQNQATLTFSIGEWQEITYVYNPDNSTIYAYKNGILENTSTNSSYYWTTESPITNSRSTLIGMNTQGGWSDFFEMMIGNVKIYNKALNEEEVIQNFSSMRKRYIPDGYQIDKALYFPGIHDYVDIPEIVFSSGQTINFWMNSSELDNYRSIFGISSTYAYFRLANNNETKGFELETDTDGILYLLNGSQILFENTWQMITIVWNQIDGKFYLYVDGVYKAVSNTANDNTLSFTRLGTGYGSVSSSHGLLGMLKEFVKYDVELTTNDMAELYNNGIPTNANEAVISNVPDAYYPLGNYDYYLTAKDLSENENNGTYVSMTYDGNVVSSGF